jgi:outer membrane protein assembly factor BamB
MNTRGLLLTLLLIGGLLAAGCSSVANPQGWAAPVVNGDAGYVSIDAGKMGDYQLTTGIRRWQFPGEGNDLKLEGIYGTPVLQDGILYVTGYSGGIAAVSATDGGQRWQLESGDRVVGGALVLGDTVYVGTDQGDLLALNRTDGAERWRQRAGNEIWSTPVADGSAIIVAAMDGTVTAFNPDGSQRWQQKVAGAAIAGVPALRDGVLYLGSYDRHIYAVDAASGETRWQSSSADNWFWTEPVVDTDTVLAGNLDGHVYAFDRQTGEQRWRTNVAAPVRARMAVMNGVLVVPTGNGTLWGLQSASGEQAWQPVTVGGKLYADLTATPSGLYLAAEVGKKSHRLYRVDAAAGSVTEIPLVKP